METDGVVTIKRADMKAFHFQEIDWLICFPSQGNERKKYLYYTVGFVDLEKKPQLTQTCLSDLVGSPVLENGFPHTVGYFKVNSSPGVWLPSHYLELRIVQCLEEFWKFLNDLNI